MPDFPLGLLRQGQEPWDDAAFELGEVLDAPSDRIVAHQRARMRGTASGADVGWSYWHVTSSRPRRSLAVVASLAPGDLAVWGALPSYIDGKAPRTPRSIA